MPKRRDDEEAWDAEEGDTEEGDTGEAGGEDEAGLEAEPESPRRALPKLTLPEFLRRGPTREAGSEELVAQPVGPKPYSTVQETKEAVDEIATIPADDEKFLFDTGADDPFISGAGATDVIMGMTASDREYLFGTGAKQPKRKTKYSVGKAKRKGGGWQKGTVTGDSETDEFLFGTRGAIQ